MKAQYGNQLLSSFMLFLDHRITASGEALFNISGGFYPTNNNINGLYTYSSQFKPIIADHSITNAIKMTGIYLNGVFISPGISGLTGINYKEGELYFTNPITGSNNLTGSFSISEIPIQLTDKEDSELLFETKFVRNPINNINISLPTGLSENQSVYPVIYLKNDGGNNQPWAFGGVEETRQTISAIIIMDSQFNLDAVTSILQDTVRCPVALFNGPEMPFNYMGYHRNGYYHYNNLATPKVASDQFAFIEDTFVTKFTTRGQLLSQLKQINPGIFPALAEFTLCRIRTPRL